MKRTKRTPIRTAKAHSALRLFMLGVIFSPIADARQEAAASISQFELRGILQSQEIWRFSIRDTKTKGSAWLALESSWNGLTPIDYEPESKVLTVSLSGIEHRITLIDPDPSAIEIVSSVNTTSVSSSETTLAKRPPPPPPPQGPPKLPPPSQKPPALSVDPEAFLRSRGNPQP